jgi:hypothetical protein
MPVKHLGYRPSKAKLTRSLTRWWCISSSGVKLAQKSALVKRMLFAAWLPVVYWGVAFLFIGQALEGRFDVLPATMQNRINRDINKMPKATREQIESVASGAQRLKAALLLKRQFRGIPQVNQLADSLLEGDDSSSRNRIWCWLMMSFFRYPQGLMILFLVGAITPALISRDIRSRAFLLYFSRPISKTEYILGKFFIPATFIALVTTLPAIALYVFAVLMSPDLSVVASTWDVPLRVLLGTLVLAVPTVSIALMFSSLTQESRFASFSWFAFFTLGHAAWLAVVFSYAFRNGGAIPFDVEVMEIPSVKRWGLLSLYNNIGEVQGWVFGFSTLREAWPGMAVLLLITAGSLAVIYRQISSPMRV